MFTALKYYHSSWARCPCEINAEKMIKLIKLDNLQEHIIDQFYKSIGSNKECLNINKAYMEKIFPILCKIVIPPIDILKYIMLSSAHETIYHNFALILGDKKFNDKQSAVFVEALNKHPKDDKLTDFILKYCALSKNFLLCHSKKISNLMKQQKIIKKDMILISCNALIYEDLIKKYMNVWDVNFENICFSGSPELIEHILKNKKDKILDNHLNSIFLTEKNIVVNRTKYTINSLTSHLKSEKIAILLKYGYTVNATIIKKIMDTYHDTKILKYIDKNLIFNYMMIYTNKYGYRFSDETFCDIIQTYGFRDDLLEKILYNYGFYNIFTKLLDRNKTFTLTSNQVKLFAERLKYGIYSVCDNVENNNRILANIVVKFMEFNEENIYQLLKSKNKEIYYLFNKSPLPKTSLILEGLCYSCEYFLPTIYEFMEDIEFTSKHFEGICNSRNIEIINDIYQKTRIPIKSEHFKAVVSSRKIYLKKYHYSKKDVSKIDHVNNNIITLLFKYGYKLKYDDLESIIENNVKIDEIEKYGIIPDKKIYELSCEHNFFLFDHFEGVDDRLVKLVKIILEKGGLPKVRKFYDDKTNEDIVPDRYCMESVCQSRNNFPIYEFLVQKGGIPTYTCLKNLVKNMEHKFASAIINDLEYNNVVEKSEW